MRCSPEQNFLIAFMIVPRLLARRVAAAARCAPAQPDHVAPERPYHRQPRRSRRLRALLPRAHALRQLLRAFRYTPNPSFLKKTSLSSVVLFKTTWTF